MLHSNIKANKIEIGPDCYISKTAQINVEGIFKLGRCSYIGDGCVIACNNFEAGEYLYMANDVEVGRGGNRNPESNVKIGNHVGIFENTIINPNSPVTIGNDVGIGSEVMIWTHGAWLDITQGFPADFGPVTIGNNVWLPARSIMLPNTSIGDNCVIGIGSTITKDIPAGSMAAGTPCKVLRQNAYPKKLTDEELEDLITPIIEYWKSVLAPAKKLNYLVGDVSFKKKERIIELVQVVDDVVPFETYYDIEARTITGFQNNVSEDLRDFLRRRGIKFYTGKPFKSI